jgi:hypothetical protein
MSRLKFLSAFFMSIIAYAQTRINTNNLRTNDPVNVNPDDFQLWATTGDSFFTRVRLGPGLSVRRVNNRIEIFGINQNFALVTVPLTRQSARVYTANRPLINSQIFYNGLFQTPSVDYSVINGNSVNFLFDIPEESVVTATTLGV